jgi:hypothetical protein
MDPILVTERLLADPFATESEVIADLVWEERDAVLRAAARGVLAPPAGPPVPPRKPGPVRRPRENAVARA